MTVASLQQFLRDAFPDSPPTTVVEDVANLCVRVRLPIETYHRRPGGTVSGPTLMTLADSSAYLAVIAEIGPVALAVTTSLHIDFLRKPALVDVIAEATILKLGKRLAVIDVALRSDGESDLVAKAQITYSIPPR